MAGLKGITINTAPEAEPHIYAEDDAAIYLSLIHIFEYYDLKGETHHIYMAPGNVQWICNILFNTERKMCIRDRVYVVEVLS